MRKEVIGEFMFNKKPQEDRDNLAEKISESRENETVQRFKHNPASNFFHAIAREKITSEQTESPEQANIMASRELADAFLSCMEDKDIGRFTESFAMRAEEFFKKKYKDNKRASEILEKFKAESTYRDDAQGSFYYETGIGLSLAHLPYDEAFSYAQKFISAVESPDQFDDVEAYQFNSKNFKNNIALALLKLQCDDAEKIKKFVQSEMASHVEPEWVIQQAARKKMGAEVIKPLMEKYGVDTVAKLALFGETGIFRNFEKSEKKELLARIFAGMDSKTRAKAKKNEGYNEGVKKWRDWDSRFLVYLSMDDGYVREKLAHLEGALKEGIVPENYDEVFKNIETSIHESSKHPSSYYVGERSERDEASAKLAKLQLEADRLSNKELGVEGKDIEVVDSRLFSEGRLIAVLEGTILGKKSTNGNVIAWKLAEHLDSDTIMGRQVRISIWGYKKGDDKPSELYSANHWTAGKLTSLSNPEVSDDGTITFTVQEEGGDKETITKTIS